MDATFKRVHERGENPVWTGRKVRKGKEGLDLEEHDNHGIASDSEPEGGIRGAEIEKEEISKEGRDSDVHSQQQSTMITPIEMLR